MQRNTDYIIKKTSWFFLISMCFILQGLSAQETPTKEYMARYQDIMARTQWWREARFVMFIHFGAYAVPARGEWVKSVEKLNTDQYQKYIDAFIPPILMQKNGQKRQKQPE